MEKKYKNIVPTVEEEKAFQADFNELAKKHSFHIELVPQFKGNKDSQAYEIVCMMLLQKVVEDTEEGVVSDNPEVNPAIKNEPAKEAE